LKEALDIEVTLVGGRSGVFEVAVDGRVVARKTWEGFPTEDTIIEAVRKALA